mmetsp:Transcript_28659/g.65898  ORF Transcript_28659/g.65898 Transcript_28659/m.65898 type:complete len:241 (-) Transcript_28659:227-949(-)
MSSSPISLNFWTCSGRTHSTLPSFACVRTSPHSSFQLGYLPQSRLSSSLSDFFRGSFSFSLSKVLSAKAHDSSNFPFNISEHWASTFPSSSSADCLSPVISSILSSPKLLSSPTTASCESNHSPITAFKSGMTGKPASLPAPAATLSTVSPSFTYGSALATHSLGNSSSNPLPPFVLASVSEIGSMKKMRTCWLNQSFGLLMLCSQSRSLPCFLYCMGRKQMSFGASSSAPISSVESILK